MNNISLKKFMPGKTYQTVATTAVVLGALLFAVALFKDSHRAWFGYLTSFFYFTSIGLGGLVLAAINHVVKAGWSVTVRRFMEAFASFVPVAFIGALVLLFGAKQLYIWLDPEIVGRDALLAGKSAYLNQTFFIIRLVLFFVVWCFLGKKLVGLSTDQDVDGDENKTVRSVRWGIGFIAFFAISYSLFSVDTLMSLQPHWYSTIWGVYCFAGMLQSTFAALILIVIYCMKHGLLDGLVNDNHLHDLGKFLKAFTVFYAYIAFSQFLLIWYANLPEETIFYLARSSGGWLAVSLSLLFFKFLIPFLLLLPRAAKRTPSHLIMVSCLILVMQYVDVYWMVFPNYTTEKVVFGYSEISTFLLFAGLFMFTIARFLKKHNIIPLKDPRLDEALHHEVVY